MAEEARAKADLIGTAFQEQVQQQAEADALGSVGSLYDALWEDTDESGLDTEAKGQRWLELMTMSLGYWLDCLVLDDVIAATGATAQEAHDVALFRELLRHESAEEVAIGRMVGRLVTG